MDVGRGFLAAGDVELASARCAGAYEYCVPVFRQQRLEAVDALTTHEFDPEVENVVAFLVDDEFREAETRDLGTDHAARLRVLVEHDAAVAKWREIAGDRERGRAAAHQRNALAVRHRSPVGQATLDVVLVVGSHPL